MEKQISLAVKCPECHRSLMDSHVKLHNLPAIRADIEIAGERGIIHLCPVYGCYERKANIPLPDRISAKFFCPECHKSLISDKFCPECSAKMVGFDIEGGGVIIFCSRVGCKEHDLLFENPSEAGKYLHDDTGYFN
ncbi:MAG: hypothetical protein JXJ22_07990 [Bacteroidales bacterium]|nr:hypothetical protein [Bacteroidales bacterium]